jgi:hypothetical protein
MTPISVAQTGAGRSSIVQVDNFANPFNVGLHIVLSGAATYNIELTPQDPMDATPTVWTAAPSLSAQTTGQAVSMTVPCRGITINVTAGVGTVTAYVVQSGER